MHAYRPQGQGCTIFKMVYLRFVGLNFSIILNSRFIGSKFQPSTLGYKKVSALRGYFSSKTFSTKPCYDNDGVLTLTCLKQLLTERDIQLFDVRTREEVKAGQIPGAVNIPFDELQEAFSLSPTEFERKYNVPKPGLKDDITFHCRTGKRAQKAVEILQGMGFKRAHNFTGGWEEWQKSMEDKSTK